MIVSRRLVKGIPSLIRHFSAAGTMRPESEAYTVTEVQIPASQGSYIAGKLWKGNDCALNHGDATINKYKNIAPIICIHGWQDNACSFDTLLPLIMKPNMMVYAMDLPGHGFSSHTTSTHYDSHMDGFIFIRRIIQHFGWNKVILMGHSLGAIISYTFSGVYPEIIDGYIAMDALRPIPIEPIKALRRTTEILFKVEEKLSKRLPPPAYTYDEIVERSYLGRQKSISVDGVKLLLQRGATQRPDGKYSFNHDLRVTIPTGMGRFSSSQTLAIGANIGCPVCVIKGEPGNDYEPRELFLEVVDNIRKRSNKKVEFHLVPGTHHFHLNSPELVAPIINKFLWE